VKKQASVLGLGRGLGNNTKNLSKAEKGKLGISELTCTSKDHHESEEAARHGREATAQL
jgi:hypothetical protein